MTACFLLAIALLASLISHGSAEIDEELVKISLRAMELVEVLKDKDTADLEHARLFVDGSVAALLVKEDGYCFAIFDTTEPLNLADWGENIDLGYSEICRLDDEESCCMVRRGYHQAYAEPNYRVALDVGIIDCYAIGYEIIFAGHSAGGAIASVAAVALSAGAKPILISFGQPPSLVGDCSVIDKNKYYHWVNTDVNGDGNLDYDPVPDITLTSGSKQAGRLLLMGEGIVVLYESGEAPSMMSWGFDAVAHATGRYIERLNQYQGKGDLNTSGWGMGFACNVDEECMSGKCEGSPSYWRSGTCQE